MSKSILVTGGSGSYGHALVQHVLQNSPHRIVIYSRDEQKQEQMAREFQHPSLRFFIGDVRDRDRLEFAMRGCETVIHAAALKIVPTAEYNPTECIATNIGGAENVVKAALRTKEITKVLALSTDKAVNPINLYGASKLAAEKIFIAANALAAGHCSFSVMRYGNVVGSRGSVIPLFKKLIAEGKPLTITDERMTRFWITLPQAVAFSMRCLDIMVGREVFIPKIPSMRIMDLALAMAPERYGIEHIGIRPGEKLHECLLTEDEARETLDYGEFYAYIQGSRPNPVLCVRAGFRYESNTNDKWLTKDQLKEMI